MCGIAGKLVFRAAAAGLHQEALRVSGVLSHRGPDDAGFIMLQPDGYSIHFSDQTHPEVIERLLLHSALPIESAAPLSGGYLLHRRLSILDLSPDAHQPMVSKDGQWLMVYNGEVYNYLEIRAELEQEGIRFSSSGDSEVVLAAFAEWGTDCFRRFDGMFAMVFHHIESKTIVMARDGAGVKPLYYWLNSDFLSFASEQKALLAMEGIACTLNEHAVGYFFLNPGFHEPFGDLFEGMHEFPNGCYAVFDPTSKQLKTRDFVNKKMFLRDGDAQELAPERLRAMLDHSVRLRLQADVPVASCLSGGLDSSTLVCLASGHLIKPMDVFCAVFPGESFDESSYARAVAAASNSMFHEVETNPAMLKADLRDLVYSQDTPLWSTSTYAQYSVMREVQRHGIKVVLDGQGSDELFAGYPAHYYAYWNELFMGFRFSKLLQEYRGTPSEQANFKSWIKRNAFQAAFNYGGYQTRQAILTKKFPDLGWLDGGLIRRTLSGLQDYLPVGLKETLGDEFYAGRLRTYLKCEDRCSMRFSVEARTPFADDQALLRAASGVHSTHLISAGINKNPLRRAMSGIVPDAVLSRRDKLGYVTPNSDWLAAIGNEALDWFSEAGVPFFDSKRIEKDWRAAVSGSDSHNGRLFRYLSFAVWYAVFFKKR